MHKRFDHQAIEKKWQEKWEADALYDVGEREKTKDKEYVLVELPYPSGNLHIGHWYAFAVPDIYVRYKRMLGTQVLYPMGFDAFGLPAENAALKRDLNPKEWTNSNIAYMREQLASMGNAFSWDKTASTTDPEYYKWTQWMFTQFFENNIAYRGEALVNWDPIDNTVIANEQVLADGTSERSGAVVEKKKMPQWMLRITDFADALIDDLDDLEWPEFIKESQRNWIGRSKGAEIDFPLSTGDTATVFTTRADTLFGATYMVLAPEHELVTKNQDSIQNWADVAAYIEAAKMKAEQDRLDGTKEKTGVKLEGILATNPASGEEIPVFISDYVLAGYGTGAIMAVPAHDERDYEFAQKFDIQIIQVITPNKDGAISDAKKITTGPGALQNSNEFNEMNSEEAKKAIIEKVSGRTTNTYRLRDWSIGRQRYWGVPIPIVYDPDGKAHPIPKEHLPWLLPEDVDFRPTGEPPLAKSDELRKRTEDIFGVGWTPEVETMDTFVDSSWYFMRYLDNTNDDAFAAPQKLSDWMPINMYFGGAEHTTMHLLYSRFWVKALQQLGLVGFNEPYKRRINRSLIMGPDGNKMSKSKGNVVDPDEQVERVGSDTVKMYLSFMGPYAEVNQYPFDLGGIAGIRRFLERVNGLHEHLTVEEIPSTTTLLHKTIKKVRTDITEFKFNTAISAMMVFVNHVEKSSLTTTQYESFIKLLAPFAPHLTEELWNENHKTSVHTESYPDFNPDLATDTEVTIGVQVNGKLRADITIAPNATETDAVNTAKNNAKITERLAEGTLVKTIYIPGKILNFIVKME